MWRKCKLDPAFWSTQAGAELDLRLLIEGRTLDFEIKRTDRPSTTRSMHSALEDLRLDHLYVIHAGRQSFPLAPKISALAWSAEQNATLAVRRSQYSLRVSSLNNDWSVSALTQRLANRNRARSPGFAARSGQSVHDVERVPECSVQFGALDLAETAYRVGVEVADRHGDDIVATDHTRLRQALIQASSDRCGVRTFRK
jgi:hypothetical protein